MSAIALPAPILLSRIRFEKLLIILLFIWVSEAGLYPVDSQMGLAIIKPLEQPIRYVGFLACGLLFALNWRQAFANRCWTDLAVFGIWCLVAFSTVLNWRTASLAFLPLMLAFLCACIAMRSLSFNCTAFVARLMQWTMYGSVLTVLLLPEYGLMAGEHSGRWRGLFLHKNQFGAFAAFFLVLALFLPGYTRPMMRWIDVAVASVALINSESSTALGAVLLALPFCLFVAAKGRLPTIILAMLTIFVLLLGIYLTQQLDGGIFGLVGRDATFSGRTLIWDFFIPLVQQRPWLGWGHESALIYGEQLQIAQAIIWSKLRSPHNSYIVLALSGGFGAVAGLMLALATGIVREIADAVPRPAILGTAIVFAVGSAFEAWLGFSICLGLLLFLTQQR